MRHSRWRHARPAIEHLHKQHASIGQRTLHHDLARTGRHGAYCIDCVEQQIAGYLLQMHTIGKGQRQIRRQLQKQRYAIALRFIF